MKRKNEKDQRERKNGHAREEWVKRKAARNAAQRLTKIQQGEK